MDQAVAVYFCIFLLLIALLYDRITKRIPTRLLADQGPKSGFGLIPASSLQVEQQ